MYSTHPKATSYHSFDTVLLELSKMNLSDPVGFVDYHANLHTAHISAQIATLMGVEMRQPLMRWDSSMVPFSLGLASSG